MSIAITGMGWVTPLGTGLEAVYDSITRGEKAAVAEALNPLNQSRLPYIPVPKTLLDAAARNSRLRRSSPISCMAATAGLEALSHAGISPENLDKQRTAVLFSIVTGGVFYTRKFYEMIATQGAHSASPLLFPETVYNAPASHLSALLGIDGASYTLVGDASVGIAALKMASQLLATGQVDRCIVVGSEEIDWVLCEAYARLKLGKKNPGSKAGMTLAEGSAALVLEREGPLQLEHIENGAPFLTRKQAAVAIREVMNRMAPGSGLIVGSANGTFIDSLEAAAIAEHQLPAIHPKACLGEALGASALIQTIYAALVLQKTTCKAVAVSCLGLSHQAAGVRICLSPAR